MSSSCIIYVSMPLTQEQRANALQNIYDNNLAKRQELESLTQVRLRENRDAEFKSKQDALVKANDFARNQIYQNSLKSGKDSISAFHDAVQLYPLPKASDQLAVEDAYQKHISPAPHFGAAQMDVGGNTVFGQTNNAGRFFPIGSKTPVDPNIKVQIGQDDNSKPIYQTVPTSRVPAVIATLPPEARTNQFNLSALAGIRTKPSASVSVTPPSPVDDSIPPEDDSSPSPAPIPDNPTISPDSTPSFFGQATQAVANSPTAPTPTPTAAITPQFKDKTGTVWTYIGNAADPTTDKNPASWQSSQ